MTLLKSPCIKSAKIPLDKDVGIASNIALDNKMILPSTRVRIARDIIPRRGVHLNRLPDMNDEKKPTRPFPRRFGPRMLPPTLSSMAPTREPRRTPFVAPPVIPK